MSGKGRAGESFTREREQANVELNRHGQNGT
jgi:hypothetical protein